MTDARAVREAEGSEMGEAGEMGEASEMGDATGPHCSAGAGIFFVRWPMEECHVIVLAPSRATFFSP